MPEGFIPYYIAAGLALCLFGWVLYWVGLRLLGAALGAIAALALAWTIFQHVEAATYAPPILIVAGIAGGLLGLVMITNMHYFFFFITGAMLGLVLATAFESSYPGWFGRNIDTPLRIVAFHGGASLAVGLLVVFFHRVIVILVTAITGAFLVAMGVPPEYAAWLFLPLLIGSVLLQLGILRAVGGPGKAAPEEEKEAS